MKSRINFYILFAIALLLSAATAFAGGDLGGGGAKIQKTAFELTAANVASLKSNADPRVQKQIWLDSLSEEDAAKIYEEVFKSFVQPQLNSE